MKTHKHLWNEFISKENFDLAVVRALRNKKKTAEIRRFLENAPENTESLRQMVVRGEFTTSEYRAKTVYEPKRREISILPFYPDRIIHHALMNILIPIWDKMFITDSYACRPGYGIHTASKRTMQFARRDKYCLQCDIRKFYPTIRHDVMLKVIGRKIRDKKLMAIIENIMHSTPDPGIPIGNFCSQWFGNLYLNELDTFVKQKLHCADYLRYCDDFLLFSNDKGQLNAWRGAIREFLSDHLGQTYSFAEIMPVSCGVDFIGYRHFPEKVLLRKSTILRMRRRLKRYAAGPQNDHARMSLASMRGWAMHARTNLKFP